MEYFEKGEIVYLINNHGEDFKVKILIDRFYDEVFKTWYYLVEPLEFKSFSRIVPCTQCYKNKGEEK